MRLIQHLKETYNSIHYYKNRFIEKILGVEFIKPYLDNPLYGKNYMVSSSSSGKPIIEIFKGLKIDDSCSILDIGCGKGRAMNLMRRFPFNRIDGIEFIEELTVIARKNFITKNEKRVSIYFEDATKFTKYKEYNFFYFYNPFSANIFEIVMIRVYESIKELPRSVTIIYVNPVCHEQVIKKGFSPINETKDQFGNSIIVYKNINWCSN